MSSLLHLADFFVKYSQWYTEKEDAIIYLEWAITYLEWYISYLEWVTGGLHNTNETRIEEPKVFIKLHIAILKLKQGNIKETKNLIEEGKSILDSITDIDPSVYACYYWASLKYHISCHEYNESYKNALLFLAYDPIARSESFKLYLAYELSISALLGDKIYNFGELLSHPIIQSLIRSNFYWLYSFLKAFSNGDLDCYQELCRVHSHVFCRVPALVKKKKILDEKINILCVMEIIFNWPPEDRTIPLTVIAERTRFSIEDVENFVMKSLSLHLIEGLIDQDEGMVHVSWVQPRVLGILKIKSLRDRLDNWVEKIQNPLITLEEENELIAQ